MMGNENEKIRRAQCRRLLKRLETEEAGVHSLMVWQKGETLLEHWWSPYDREKKHTLFSVSKTFTGLAVGFAVQDGFLSLNDRVVSFFPEYLPSPACANMEQMTVEHLLTMSTGLESDPHAFYEKRREDFQEESPCCYHGFQPDLSSDWIRNFFHSYVKYRPGAEFVYCTHGSYMLSVIVQKTTGKRTADYLAEKLFVPLDITDYFWETGPDGRTVGGWGLMLKTEDLLKVGIFLLQEGRWKGEQLLNREWLQAAVTSRIPITNLPGEPDTAGYGYQIWIDQREHAYSMRGAFGQLCMVFPDRELVVAVTAGAAKEKPAEIMAAVWDELIERKSGQTQAGENEAMSRREADGPCPPHISFPEGIPSMGSPESKRVSGVRYLLADNFLRFRSIRLDFGRTDRFTLETEAGCFTAPIGYQEWLEGKTCVRTEETDTDTSILFEHLACAGAWEGKTYHLRICFDETSYIHDLWITFPGEGIFLIHRRNCSFIKAVNLTLAGVREDALGPVGI